MTAMEAVDSKGIRWIRHDERSCTLDVAYTASGEYRYFWMLTRPRTRKLTSSSCCVNRWTHPRRKRA